VVVQTQAQPNFRYGTGSGFHKAGTVPGLPGYRFMSHPPLLVTADTNCNPTVSVSALAALVAFLETNFKRGDSSLYLPGIQNFLQSLRFFYDRSGRGSDGIPAGSASENCDRAHKLVLVISCWVGIDVDSSTKHRMFAILLPLPRTLRLQSGSIACYSH